MSFTWNPAAAVPATHLVTGRRPWLAVDATWAEADLVLERCSPSHVVWRASTPATLELLLIVGARQTTPDRGLVLRALLVDVARGQIISLNKERALVCNKGSVVCRIQFEVRMQDRRMNWA